MVPYLSAMMNIDPLCCKQVPLLLMWLVEMLRGWGKPEWYQVPCQVAGNWHSCCACCGTVVKPTLINAKDRVHKKLWPAGLNRPPLFRGTFSRDFVLFLDYDLIGFQGLILNVEKNSFGKKKLSNSVSWFICDLLRNTLKL